MIDKQNDKIYSMLQNIATSITQKEFLLFVSIMFIYRDGGGYTIFQEALKKVFGEHYPAQQDAFHACENAGLGYPIQD
jgi:hypothetical protein